MTSANIKLGLKENWQQFTILVIVNAFVGGMIGMERTIFPQFAESEFGVASKAAILSFITAFGITKALTNYFAGRLANKFGRRNLLIFGWILAVPIPFILISASGWNWVIFANILLGVSQGLTWSSTVVMKIDLVGEKKRGFAMGLNEFAGYFSVGVVAFLTGYIADKFGITPYPFYIGIFISLTGLLITLLWVKDTRAFVHKESITDNTEQMEKVFIETTFKNKTLSSVTQAGMVNNLNDGMIWGLLPIVLLSLNYNTEDMGLITAVYPAVWGIGQLFTGSMSDVYSKKNMLFLGMLLQGIAILFIPAVSSFLLLSLISIILGLGTALVYPTFLSAVAQAASPAQRAESIGVFRFWRDLGYAIGAIVSGISADLFGMKAAIIIIGMITVISSLIIKLRMPDKSKSEKECIEADEVRIALIKNEKVQLIDVSSKEEYEKAHIPYSINVSLSELKNTISKFDKNCLYVTVSRKGNDISSAAAKILKEMGFNAVRLCGGTNKWLNIS